MNRYAVLALALALGACATDKPAEPVVKTVTVTVPVAQPCATKAKLGADPVYADNDAALAAVLHPGAEDRLKANPADVIALQQSLENLGDRLKKLLAGRLQRIQRDREKQAALDGCEAA